MPREVQHRHSTPQRIVLNVCVYLCDEHIGMTKKLLHLTDRLTQL